MKKIILLQFWFILVLFANASAFDTIHLPERQAADTNQVITLNKLALELWNNDPAQTESYGREALALAKKTGYIAGTAEAHRVIGVSFWSRGQYDKALESFLSALKIYKQINHLPGLASVYMNMGLVYDEQEKYENALEHHQMAINLFTKTDKKQRLATAYNNTGAVYHKTRQYNKAIEFYNQALTIRESLKDQLGVAESLNNLGVVFQNKNEYTKALDYFNRSLSIKQQLKDYNGLAMTWSNVGEIYSQQGHYTLAEQYFQKALDLSVEYGFIKWTAEVYERLKRMEEAKGNYKLALKYYEKQITLQDSLLGAEKIRMLTEMEARYQTAQQKHEIELQKQRINILIKNQKMKSMVHYGLVGIIILILVTGFLLLRAQRIRILKNRQLLEAREALIKAELENKRMKEKELQRALELKSQELTSYSMNMIQKNEMIEEFRDNIEQMRKLPAEKLPQQLKNMCRLLDNTLHIDKDWEDFKLHFAQVHPSLFRNLKDRFPELSNNDLKLCALIKLNLNLKEAASILGIAPESVKSARYRLRKKFNLAHGESLVDFIRSMETENTALSA